MPLIYIYIVGTSSVMGFTKPRTGCPWDTLHGAWPMALAWRPSGDIIVRC